MTVRRHVWAFALVGGLGCEGEPIGASSAGGGAAVSSSATGGATSDAASSGSDVTSSGSLATTGAGGGASDCKRGIAANTPPGPALSSGITWWYNWALQGSGQGAGIEFVPMAWGKQTLGDPAPAGSKFLLGFNEPNFHAQSDLTAQEAAESWPLVETSAGSAIIVGPAMNFCGPAANCNGTNPYQYLKDFFAACPGCRVDHIAVHWYNCDLPSLRDYLEPGGALEGFEQFGKPIWLTEFSCDGGASVAEQQAYMEEAIPYLEANPHVLRYAWFSAGPIPNAKLTGDDGSPTPLGEVYSALPQACRR